MDINSEKKDQIMAIISEEFEEKQSKANELRKSIAVYEGQATLGKMINVVLKKNVKIDS